MSCKGSSGLRKLWTPAWHWNKRCAELPIEQREVVVMHVWGAMTLEEIAKVLELSANTVASRYRYGLRKLREIMQGPRGAPGAEVNDGGE